MSKNQDLLLTGAKLLLVIVFIHRCILIYDRWSLGRTEKHQTSQPFTGHEPYPAFTFRRKLPLGRKFDQGTQLREFVSLARLNDKNSGKHEDLLENADDYFTEFVRQHKTYTDYFVTLHLPHANFSVKIKPRVRIVFNLMPEQSHFYFSVHPPHHVSYENDILKGLQRKYLVVDEVDPGRTLAYIYSFSIMNIVKKSKCERVSQMVDTCERNFVEDRLGCKLPWMRGDQKESSFGSFCSHDQVKNVSIAMRELEGNTCSHRVSCELYVPKIAEENHKSYPNPKRGNVTNQERCLSLMFYTDQQSIPIEATVLSYDSLDVMADVGGYLGLLLGASCLSMIKSAVDKLSGVVKSCKTQTIPDRNYQK